MKKVKLGHSNLQVSEVCLGTMTWGMQNNQKQANEQIDYALNKGINFLDTAEMYPIPPKQKTQGDTERIIGNWLAQDSANREKVVIASKVVGGGLSWIRDGANIDGKSIKVALDESLHRLRTDYIDLYQLHWPNRTSPNFGKHWPGNLTYAEVNVDAEREAMLDILQSLDECIKAGKIRYCGLSNETPWGVNEYIQLSKEHNLPRMVSLQNEFNLLHLKDVPYQIENCIFNDIAYLPWSPLSSGILTGKYRNGVIPQGSRWSYSQRNGLFRDTPAAHAAVEAYAKVAERFDLSLAQMALAWVYNVEGVTSTIIGATSLKQLKEDINAYQVVISDDMESAILDVIKQYPLPF